MASSELSLTLPVLSMMENIKGLDMNHPQSAITFGSVELQGKSNFIFIFSPNQVTGTVKFNWHVIYEMRTINCERIRECS